MSLSSATAQTRELTELRNHLKWLDEERRKSSKKMAELEQRLAQQGRELADRDQKIQELEWHVNNFAERFERLPDLDTNAAGTEQRLQDLEWHLANMSGQLTRLPNMEEERARLVDETNRAVASAQERVEASQSLLESRLRTEMVALRESDEQHQLSIRLNDQAQAINQMDQQFAALQESVGILSGQLRERTTTLAAESQANFSSLAAGMQDHLDTIRAENESRTELLAASLAEHITTLRAENETRFDLRAAEWQARLDEALASRAVETSPDFLGLTEQLAILSESQQQWQSRWPQLEQQNLQLEQRTVELGLRNDEYELKIDNITHWSEQYEQKLAAIAQWNEQYEQKLAAIAQWNEQYEQKLAELAQLREQYERTDAGIAEWRGQYEQKIASLAQWSEEFESKAAELEQQLEQTEQKNALLETALREQLVGEIERKSLELQQQVEQIGSRYEDLSAQIGPMNFRQTELEDNLTKLGHIREIMPLLDRLEQELELRQAEEVRLSNLIGTQENRFTPLAASLEEMKEMTSAIASRVSESERTIEELRASAQDFNDNFKPALSEFNRRVTSVADRLTVLNNNIMKADAGVQSLSGDQSELREIVVNLTDDMRRNQSDITRQIDGWQATLDENKDTIERFTQQWITLSNQYKEARMAVQNFAHWQKQLEQQKREAGEMLRIESNRMQTRWDGFLMEIQEKLKNFELDLGQKWQAFEMENEQKWSASRRNEQIRHEELAAVDELIQKLQQDNRNLIWRVQAAQADAIKKWPRLLMEEVEKAVEINPNRRLTTTTAPRADMSVVDAIEQGLITIDYNDDPGLDL